MIATTEFVVPRSMPMVFFTLFPLRAPSLGRQIVAAFAALRRLQ